MAAESAFSLAGRVALVTGASRGLGAAIALRYARAGARVVLNARNQAALSEVEARITAAGGHAEVAAFDVSDEAAQTAALQDIAARHGRLDIVVANAGIQHRRALTEFATQDFRRVIDTNLTAVWTLAREAARLMLPAKRGRIIITGSISAVLARPTIHAYVASKGAVHALARSLAVELAPHHITVNALAPGFFATEMNTALTQNAEFNAFVERSVPMARWGSPDEIGGPALFLASDEASFVTGHILTVDGGMTASM
jgi:gluconate 5-dehydrogenase